MENRVGTVINFCTNEIRFIGESLRQALQFSQHVVVPIASHFFDGEPEDRNLLESLYGAFPQCLFIEYPFIPDQMPPSVFKAVRPDAFWHSLSRLIGSSFLEPSVELVFFLDADEVADGARVSEWLKKGGFAKYRAARLSNYWYFRDPSFRATVFEDSIVLIERKALTADSLLHNGERAALYEAAEGKKERGLMGCDEKPLFHHFSWVRSIEEMLKKVRCWSHRKDRDWEFLVRKEFSAPFQGTDFVHGYSFETVKSSFDLSFSGCVGDGKNVIRLSAADVVRFARMKKRSFWHRLLQKA